MPKQVKNVEAAPSRLPRARNLYFKVSTFNRETGEEMEMSPRIVDLFHINTANWIQRHTWWALMNGCRTETDAATDAEIAQYLAEGKVALAEKFNAKVAA